jgi:cell division protease FtsH
MLTSATSDPVHKVTIVAARPRARRARCSLPEKDKYNHCAQKLLGRMAVCFGGRVAEEIVFGDVTAGAQQRHRAGDQPSHASWCASSA